MTKDFRTNKAMINLLRNPALAQDHTLRDWEIIVWQARVAELLGQLRNSLVKADVISNVPHQVRRHLDAAWKISELHGQAVKYELAHLREALEKLGIPVVLLKGAAYCAQNNSAAAGRVFSDIDILVPKAALDEAEQLLLGAGWIPTHLNAYDQRYYRDWMHEIPPIEHKNRSTVLDVHHTIVPPTSGIRPDPKALLDSARCIEAPELSFFRVLSPEDMIIHSTCHLFFGEFHKGLRDLYDLHALFSEFSAASGFWERLMHRAAELGLEQPVLDAMRQSQRLFGTELPEEKVRNLAARRGIIGKAPLRDWLFEQVLRPNHPSAQDQFTHFAQWLAFARSHWLRMPFPLLAYHLGHKALFRNTNEKPG